jgi:hypothetical protein
MRDLRLWGASALPILASLLVPSPAFAYIGPGVATGAIASVLGVLGAIVLGIFAVIYYPIKRVLKRRREAKRAGGETGPGE